MSSTSTFLATKRTLAWFLLVAVGIGITWTIARNKQTEAPHTSPGNLTGGNESRDHFVGTTACAECHPDNAAAHAASGHAHTFQSTADSEIARALDGTVFEDPVRGTTFHYHFDDEGLSVSAPALFGDDRFPLTYALGSGTHGMTFLSLIPHEDGGTLGVEHRATFFSALEGLGITPGQRDLSAPGQDVEHFGRFVVGRSLERCVECHTTTGYIKYERILNLAANVGCESCHGPGGEHVQAVRETGVDPAMSVADRWPLAYDEIRVCGRCHRLPEMLQKTELARESVALVRLQPVGLLQSDCYKKSEGSLRCSTCHNPHATVSQNPLHYEQICLQCHTAPDSTVCPENAHSDCLQCHMPGIMMQNTIFHDHWIRVRTEVDPTPEQQDLIHSPGHGDLSR